MKRLKTISCSLGLLLVSAVPVVADTGVPRPASLRMRAQAKKPAIGPTTPARPDKRVAQAQPAQPAPVQTAQNQPADPAAPPADPNTAPPADPSAAPADSPAPAAEPTPVPAEQAAPAQTPEPAPAAPTAPQLSVEQTATLSDEEMAKISEQAAREEVITVTGSTIERKTLTTPAPLTVLNRDDLTAIGRSTVGDILQQLPEQSNAINAQANNGGDGSTRISIRGLGATAR